MTPYKDALIEAAYDAYRAGQPAEAEAALRLAIGGSVNDAWAVYFIGHLSYLRGDLDAAAFCLTASCSLATMLRAKSRSKLSVPESAMCRL